MQKCKVGPAIKVAWWEVQNRFEKCQLLNLTVFYKNCEIQLRLVAGIGRFIIAASILCNGITGGHKNNAIDNPSNQNMFFLRERPSLSVWGAEPNIKNMKKMEWILDKKWAGGIWDICFCHWIWQLALKAFFWWEKR